MKLLHKFVLTAILTALSVQPAAAQSAAERLDEPGKLRYRELQLKFFCQCGCNYILLHCPHLVCPSAPVMRGALLNGMSAGLSDEQIVAAMVDQFGEVALSSPPAEGFNLVGWLMPGVALLGGLILIMAVARAWRRRAPAAVAASDTGGLLEKHRAAIEQEMKDLE